MAETLQGISVPITFDVDYTGIATAQQKLQDVHHEIDSMPNLNTLTQRAIDTTRYLGDTALKRYGDAYDMQFSDEADRARYIQRTNHVAKDFQASSQLLQADQGAFSLKQQHDIVSGLSKQIQTAFDQAIPNLGNIIRQRLDPDSSMSAQLPSRDIKTIQQFLYRDQEVQKALAPVHRAAGSSGLDEKTAQQLIGVLTARIQPSYTLDDYSKRRYGRSVSSQTSDFTPQISQLIPKSFLSSFQSKGYVHRPVDDAHADEVLSATGMKTLRKQLASNSDVVQAALSSGIAMRDDRGTLQLLQNISRAQHETFREQLYKTFETRATGKGGPHGEDIYELAAETRRQRLGNGNTHALLTSMRTLESLDDQAAWTRERNPSPNLYRWAEEAPRRVKQYQTMRYSPFDSRIDPKMVTTDESQMTHLVGLDKRRANSDISDAFITLSMQGYDEKNANHQRLLDSLLMDGFNNGKQQYHVVAAHRSTEEGTVLRAISQAAYQQAIQNVQPYVDQLRTLGMDIAAHDVFDLFQTDFSSLTDYRKNQDAKNKVYTSSFDTGVDLRKRKIAVIDTSYIGPDGKKVDPEDGAGWASGDVLPSSIQARGALGVKGSLISLTQQGTSLRDYYISTGMAQKKDQYGNATDDYHVWRKGVNGDMTDIIDADMVLSASMVKNKSIFRKADGTAMNSDEVSKAMNILFQMSPLRAITDYDTERKTSDRIGGQAMAFMQVPQEIAQMQMRGLSQRMRELSTPEGLKKYIFSDVENDALSAAIDRDPSLLTSSAAQKRINAYYASLARDMASGALIDFGQDPNSRIRNARLVTNPVNSFYQEGGIPEDVMQRAMSAFRRDKRISGMFGGSGEKRYSEMTDEELRKEITDTLTLQSGNVVDFANAETRQLGVIRSPTGFGNYVSAVNRAQEMRVINDAIGAVLRESPGDIYVGQKDMDTLQGADKDGDQAKVVTGKYMEMVRQSQEGYRQAIENAEKHGLITHVEAHELGTGEKINGDKMTMQEKATRFRGFIEALNKEPMHMGVADSMQRAAALTGLFNPENGESVAASLRGAEYYDLFSTFAKKPTDAQLTRGDWSRRNAIGKEYGKFIKGLPGVFQTEGVDDQDIYVDQETGEKINMRAFRDMGLSRINAHSMLNPSELMARELQGQMFAFGSGDVWTNGILRRAMEYYHEGYGGNTDKLKQGTAQRKANKAMDQILLAESMGRFFGTDQETEALRSLLDQARSELAQEFYELQASGKLDPNGPQTIKKWQEKQFRERGLLRISNYLDRFGATESRARDLLGDEKVAAEAMAQGDLGFVPVLKEEWDRIQAQKPKPAPVAETPQPQKTKQAKEHFRSGRRIQDIVDSSKRQSENQAKRLVRKPWVAMNEEERSQALADEMMLEDTDNPPWAPQYYSNERGGAPSTKPRKYKNKRGTMRDRLYYGKTDVQTDTPKDQSSSSTISQAVQQRQALQNDAAVIGELLNRGSEWSKAMRAPLYKGKEQTYSDSYLDKQTGMFRSFMSATDEYLDKSNPLTHNQETGELTGFGTALQEKRKEMSRAFLEGTAAFIEQRSDQISEKLRKDMSQAPDLDKAFEQSEEYRKLGEEHRTLGDKFLETRRIAKGISEDTPLAAVQAGLTENERKQYEKITSRASKIEDLSKKNQERVYDQYVKGFQHETRGISDLVASQQRQMFGEQLQTQNRASLINSDITGLMSEQARRMLDRRSIQDQLDQKTAQLEGYEIEKKAIAADETLTDEQKAVKTRFADAAIEQTKAQVQGLTEALANAEARFQAFSGAQGFEKLGESISGAREKLRQLSQGVQSDSALQKILSIQDTINAAKAANTKMRDESGFYSKGKWDTSTAEGKAARDAYMANLNRIRGMEGDRTQNYGAIHAQVQREHDMFMRSYGVRHTGAEAQLAQWYDDQEWRGSQREQRLRESIKETKRQIEKPSGKNRQERRQNKQEAQRHLDDLQRQLDEVRDRSGSLTSGREQDLEREATYQQERHEASLALKEAQRGVQQRQFDQRLRQMTSGRFTQRTMLGRELEFIRSTREQAVSRNEILGAQRTQKETEIKNLQAQLTTAQESEKPQIQRNLEQAQSDLKTMNQELAQNEQIINRYPSSLDGLGAAFNTAASVGLSFATRLATQVFRKALQEAKNFVKQFDAQMTQIQMVTLKSDAQMSTLGDGFIQKAIDLKASIADVTTAATALYRQGLDDQEVDNRLGDIMKFSRVGNVKVEDATKLATVAVNGGMVSSAQQAFDAVAAISDNAATDAAAITKGLQKSMYAAKSVGVSFNELVSMLAVITSKTQLSGQVAGTTMATVFSRLSRMRENQVVYDENGNATSRSDVQKALHHAGVELYENGEMRSAFDVMTDLGNVWSTLGDTQKSSISYLLGAGRQASNLQALMEGFTEVDESGRNLIQMYLSLAEASTGIVDQKNEVYLQSLAAGMTNVKTSFDALVSSIADTGAFAELANVFAELLQNIAAFNSLGGGAVGAASGAGLGIAAIVPMLIKLAPMLASMWPLLAVGGGLAIVGGVAGGIYKNYKEQQAYNSPEAVRERAYAQSVHETNEIERAYNAASSIIERNRANWNNISTDDQTALNNAFLTLKNFGAIDTSTPLQNLVRSAQSASSALSGIPKAIEDRKRNEATADFARTILDLPSQAEQFNSQTHENALPFLQDQAYELLHSYATGGIDIMQDSEQAHGLAMFISSASKNNRGSFGTEKYETISGGKNVEKYLEDMSTEEVLWALRLNDQLTDLIIDKIKTGEQALTLDDSVKSGQAFKDLDAIIAGRDENSITVGASDGFWGVGANPGRQYDPGEIMQQIGTVMFSNKRGYAPQFNGRENGYIISENGETKQFADMSIEDIVNAMIYDQLFRNTVASLGQYGFTNPNPITLFSPDGLNDLYSSAQTEELHSSVIGTLAEEASKITFTDDEGKVHSYNQENLFTVFDQFARKVLGGETIKSEEDLKTVQAALSNGAFDMTDDFNRVNVEQFTSAIHEMETQFQVTVKLETPEGTQDATVTPKGPATKLAVSFGNAYDTTYDGKKISPTQYGQVLTSLRSVRGNSGTSRQAFEKLTRDKSIEGILSNMFASADADLLQIFEAAYDQENDRWDYRQITDAMLDQYERYLAGKDVSLAGFGSEQTAAEIRAENAESLESLTGGFGINELGGSNGSLNAQRLNNLKRVFSEETITALTDTISPYGNMDLKFLGAMNQAYGTGFDYTSFMSQADLYSLEEEWMDRMISGYVVSSELTKAMQSRIGKDDYTILTSGTASPDEKRAAMQRVLSARGNVTQARSDKARFENGSQYIRKLASGAMSFQEWIGLDPVKRQEAISDVPVLQEVVNAIRQGETTTTTKTSEWLKQAEAAYRGLDLSQMYSSNQMEAAANEFIDAFAGGQESFQTYLDSHTDAYVQMMQSLLGINGLEAEYKNSAKRASKVVELRSAQMQKKYGISSLQMTSGTQENSFVQDFFRKANAFDSQKFASWYERLSPDQKAILENDSRTASFLKTDAFAALLGVDNGISRDDALRQMQEYQMGITSPLSASALADKATSLTSGFVTATSDNMEQVFAEYDAAIAQMETDNPLQAEQFRSTYGTLIQDWRNAIAGGKPEEIEKAKRAFQQAVRQNQSQNEDWFPEYMKYIQGLSSLSEATQLGTFFRLDDRRRDVQNAMHYMEQIQNGLWVSDEGLNALASTFDLDIGTLTHARSTGTLSNFLPYMEAKRNEIARGMAEAIMNDVEVPSSMAFSDSNIDTEELATEIERSNMENAQELADRIRQNAISIVNGTWSTALNAVADTPTIESIITSATESWKTSDSSMGAQFLSTIKSAENYESAIATLNSIEGMSSWLNQHQEYARILGRYGSGQMSQQDIISAIEPQITGRTKGYSDYMSALRGIGIGTQATLSDAQIGSLISIGNSADGYSERDEIFKSALLELGGSDMWTAMVEGDAARIREGWKSVYANLQARQEQERYAGEDYLSSLAASLETFRTGTGDQKTSTVSSIMDRVRDTQIAAQYVTDLIDTGFIDDTGWGYITKVLGKGYTKNNLHLGNITTGNIQNQLQTQSEQVTGELTSLIIELISDATKLDESQILSIFESGGGLNGFDIAEDQKSLLKQLIGITGFNVSGGKAGINLGASYNGISLANIFGQAFSDQKRTATSTMWDKLLSYTTMQAEANPQVQEWLNSNPDVMAMYYAARGGVNPYGITEGQLTAYRNMQVSGLTDYKYYNTMLGGRSGITGLLQTMQDNRANIDNDQLAQIYLQMLSGLGESGTALADAVKGGKITFDENGNITGDYAETLTNLLNDLSNMRVQEEMMNAPWLKDYIDLVTGLRSPSMSTRAGAAMGAFEQRDQVKQARFYMQQLNENPEAELSEQGYKTLAAITGFKEDEIKKMGRSSAGRSLLQTEVDNASETIDKMLGLAVKNSFDEKALTALTELGDNANTEEIIQAFDQAGIRQDVINLVKRLGFAVRDGIATVDISAEDLSPTLQEVLSTSERSMISKNSAIQLGKLGMVLHGKTPYGYREEERPYGNSVRIPLISDGTTNGIRGVFERYSDEDVVSMFAGDEEAARMALALRDGDISLEDWDYFAQKRISGRSVERGDYSLMERVFGGSEGTYGRGIYDAIPTNGYDFSNPDTYWQNPALQSALDWYGATVSYDPTVNTPYVQLQKSQALDLDGGSEWYDVLGQLYNLKQNGGDPADIIDNYNASVQRLGQSLASLDASHMYEGLEYAREAQAAFDSVTGSVTKANVAIADARDKQDSYNDALSALLRLRAGRQSEKDRERDIDIVKKYSGTDLKTAYKRKDKNGKTGDDSQVWLDALDRTNTRLLAEGEQIAAERAGILDGLTSKLNDASLGTIKTQVRTNGGSMDMSEVYAILNGMDDEAKAALQAELESLQAQGLTATLVASVNGDKAEVHWEVAQNQTGASEYTKNPPPSGGKGGGGGGGGKGDTGKSATDIFLERVKQSQKLFDHRQKMIQYEETKYENRGEYTNLNNALAQENDLIRGYLPALQKMISRTRSQMKRVSKFSDDWYKLRDSLFECEEKYKDLNNQIEENEKKIKENIVTIADLTATVQDAIRDEIDARIELERSMLKGRVNMEDSILEAIKSRYQKEWDLVKQDIEKKQQALEEEKGLIDERLQKRKEAAEEAKKYEELAELKSQYANISMDPTRTKDAAKLREQIQKLEEEIGWDIAEEQAEMEKQSIQDQIDAYAQYVETGDQQLEKLLADANNFAAEVSQVIGGGYEEMLAWLQASDEAYANSLESTQKQMVNSWRDTYEQMMNIVDMHGDEVDYIMGNKDRFLGYMQQSQEYLRATGDRRVTLMDEYEKMWKNMANAQLDTTTGKNLLHLLKSEGSYWAQYVQDLAAKGVGSSNKSSSNKSSSNKSSSDKSGSDQSSGEGSATGPKVMDYEKTKDRMATGGLATQTGPAWLDGTFQKPERVLSAYQTELFENMLDILGRIDREGLASTISDMFDWSQIAKVSPALTNVDEGSMQANVTSIGDVYVTLNEAQLKEDADYYEVAMRVGQVFTKELSKQGIRTTAFSF